MSKPHILLLGTCDTKLDELLYVRKQILAQAVCSVTLLTLATNPSLIPPLLFLDPLYSLVTAVNLVIHATPKLWTERRIHLV